MFVSNLSPLLFMALPAIVSANPFGLKRDSCAADNCIRAIAGTAANLKPSSSVRKVDCSSYLSYTVIPLTTTTVTVYTSTETDVTTTTSTTTSSETDTTTTTTTLPVPQKRAMVTTAITVTPTALPTYASYCAASTRYSSACSCFGVSMATTTAPTSTITVTVSGVTTTQTTSTSVSLTATTTTSTATATYTPSSCSDLGTFYGAANGRDFQNYCGQTYPFYSSDVIDTPYEATYRLCLDRCAATNNCLGVDYAEGTTTCTLLSTLRFGVRGSDGIDAAMLLTG